MNARNGGWFYDYKKEADSYVWFKIADDNWIATSDEWTKYYPANDYEKMYKEEVEKNKKLEQEIATLKEKIDKAIKDLS